MLSDGAESLGDDFESCFGSLLAGVDDACWEAFGCASELFGFSLDEVAAWLAGEGVEGLGLVGTLATEFSPAGLGGVASIDF
jgi:hypothetical protein